jgi:hypothetical protein
MTAATDEDAAPSALWRRVWPLMALAIVMTVNLAWIGLLGYELAKLL